MTTPSRETALDQGRSTPQAKGSGSNTNYTIEHAQGQYKHYLIHDIAGSISIPLDDFMKHVFNNQDATSWKKVDSSFSQFSRTARFNDLLLDYCQAVHNETDRYDTLNRLANHILDNLNNTSAPITVCRNDHIAVLGSSAKRIPDSVIVHKKALALVPERSDVDTLSEKGPEALAFHWAELLAFVEFKLENNDLTKLLSSSSIGSASATSSPKSGKATKHTQDPKLMGTDEVSLPPATSSSRGGSSRKRKRHSTDVSSRKRQKMAEVPLISGEDVLTQCASYALEMLSHGGLRTHTFGILITDDQFQLLYYDRSLPLRTDPISFIEQPAALVIALDCMQRLNNRQWGHVITPSTDYQPTTQVTTQRGRSVTSTISFSPSSLKPLCKTRFALSNGVTLTLGDVIFQQHALISRGTCVVRAEVNDGDAKVWEGKSIVVKFSFTPQGRESEGQKLKHIIDIAESNSDYQWVLCHLPEVLHYEEIPRENMAIQDVLRREFETREYEYRGLQVLVMTQLFPITELTTTATLAPVIKDVFKCYRWLYEKAGVIHRDISLNNIMYRKKDNSFKGVLSDFDLSLWLVDSKKGPSSKQRTGTMPYMAIDLLRQTPPPKHLYRHDLESLYYVILILATGYHEGIEMSNPPLRSWFGLDMGSLAGAKLLEILGNRQDLTPQFLGFEDWIVAMRKSLSNGFNARTNGTADELTLGGHVSFEKFDQIFSGRL